MLGSNRGGVIDGRIRMGREGHTESDRATERQRVRVQTGSKQEKWGVEEGMIQVWWVTGAHVEGEMQHVAPQ